MWKPWTGSGIEHLRLVRDGGGALADGVVVGVEDGSPFRVRYTIRCDARRRVRELSVAPLLGDGEELHLSADGEGRWKSSGARVPVLDGCVDADISATPFTNTPPIRRLGLGFGEPAGIMAVYVAAPEMRFEPARQRYTRLEDREGGAVYRFESLDGGSAGFAADLPVDADGLALDYPGLFGRAG